MEATKQTSSEEAECRPNSSSNSSKEGSQVVCIYDSRMRESLRMQRSLSQEMERELTMKISSSFISKTGLNGLQTPQRQSQADQVMDRIEFVDKFVRLAELARPDATTEMQKMLSMDPKRNMYQRSNTQHLINKHNSNGYNAAYIAAKHGHRKIIEFLFRNEADLTIQSAVSGKYQEQPIEVAARWQHHDLVIWMLKNLTLEQNVLDSVYEKTASATVRDHLKSKVSGLVILKKLCCVCFQRSG